MRFTVAWSCVLLLELLWTGAVDARAADPGTGPTPWVTRQMTFNIPFSVPADGAQPVGVELYVSRDLGTSWQLFARQRPDARFFQYRAEQEGNYWFASRTVHGLQRPVDTSQLRPELIVSVDLQEPRLVFEAKAGPSGEIETSWEATDPNLDPASFKVEYQSRIGQSWRPVALQQQQTSRIENSLVGRMSWHPNASGNSAHIRAEISDRAGNKAVVNRLVLLPVHPPQQAQLPQRGFPAAASPPAAPGMPAALPAAELVSRDHSLTWPADNRLPVPLQATRASDPGSTPGDSLAARLPSSYRSPAGPAASPVSTSPAAISTPSMTEASSSYPPAERPVQPPVGTQFVAAQPTPEEQADTPASASNAEPAVAAALPSGEAPRMTRSRQFQLDYDIEAVGPSGIRKVELWGTSDQGRTWSLWQTDDDRTSPLQVSVEHDGVYGFRIVIVSNSGLAGPAPRNGDPADLWVGVDSAAPGLRFTSAIYGDGDRVGQLDIRWEAEDAYFGERPISLFFSDAPAGPWTTIATGLENTGQYYWPVDPRVPKKIFLRIEARDQAGNVAQYQLDQPVNLAGLTPTARIRGVRPQ